MPEIHTEITIDAPPERVRELLADTALYPQWHPLFPQVSGALSVGAVIEVTVALPEIKPFSVRATVEKYTAGSELRWRHAYRFPGLFSWRYSYELQIITSAQVKFVQHSVYAGLLGALYHLGMKKLLERGMAELNKAVQRWGERRGISCLKC